ncbi:type I restriction enzyme, S subunit [Ectothiorhodospira magna]|uniref:Type I restriction enzyme, S subunit n=1 Tax=Ectothiorhodospira magna TaxID=867345 RepID=A0A1H9C2A4_9GAMM|nr:restriction endonuclease subunit S [Ectothiorhodospira magna]SEP95366.1 type I restriction enzyme, S subunit [Ectothiorhodospira magna]
MSFPKYPEYKDSGVDWLGEVPAHWSVRRIRYVADINPSKSEARSLAGNKKVSFIPMESVGEDGTLDLKHVRPLEEVIDGYTYVRDGDVTFAKITPCFENGKAALMEGLESGIGFATTELTVLRPKPKCSTGEFLFRVVHSGPFRLLGEARMYGAGGQKRVPDDFARDFTIAWPPLTEQATIAAFLDYETARIDALVEEQQRLIELLKEKRQAVISHAVTKGLDPDVPMKDSGVEWLGEVPAHWELTRIGWITSELTYGFTNPMPTEDDGPKMLTANDIGWGEIFYDTARSTSEFAFKKLLTDKSRPRRGDLLLTKDGTLGRVAVHDGRPACINQSVALIRTACVADPDYLCALLQASCYQSQMIFEAGGTTIKHIYITRFAKMPVALPPLHEQGKILEKMKSEDAIYLSLIAEAEKSAKLLGERRSALISAAVTGKIDVRDWRPPDNAAAAPAKALLAQEAQS